MLESGTKHKVILCVCVQNQVDKARSDLGLLLGIEPLQYVAFLFLEDPKELCRRVILQYRDTIVRNGQVTFGGGMEGIVVAIVAEIMGQGRNKDG